MFLPFDYISVIPLSRSSDLYILFLSVSISIKKLLNVHISSAHIALLASKWYIFRVASSLRMRCDMLNSGSDTIGETLSTVATLAILLFKH